MRTNHKSSERPWFYPSVDAVENTAGAVLCLNFVGEIAPVEDRGLHLDCVNHGFAFDIVDTLVDPYYRPDQTRVLGKVG